MHKPIHRLARLSAAALLAAAVAPYSALADCGKSFEELDTNGDGYIDSNEMRAMYEQKFEKYDTNRDGMLGQEELQMKYQEKRMDGGMRGGDQMKMKGKHQMMMQKLDSNNDGQISREEFMAKSDSAADKADKDGDGRISEQEFESFHTDKKQMKGSGGYGEKKY